MIMGNLPVNDIPAKVLFDTGASISFISKPFESIHDLHTVDLLKPIEVSSPGLFMNTKMMAPDISIMLGDHKFLSSPMVLGNSDIDFILGMDWLSKHKAQLDCAVRQIQLTHSSEDVIIYTAPDDTIRLFSLNEKGELNAISQIPVVCEYQDVFLEELQECLRSGQLNSLLILSLVRNLCASVLTSSA